MQQPTSSEAIGLDRSCEPWCGTFPGLGEVRVAADGSVDVTVVPASEGDPDTAAMRDAALRHGWGEALSWVRRGHLLLTGGAATPDPDAGCLILTGDTHEFGRLMPALCERGWAFLSDRYTPAQWQGDELTAYPREAPILLAERRAKKVGWTGRAARGDTDSLIVDVPRVHSATKVIGVVSLTRGRVGDPTFEVLAGHRRFEAAAALRHGGVLGGTPPVTDPDEPTEPGTVPSASDGDPTQPGESMGEQLRMAALPFAALHSAGDLDLIGDEADTVIQWWNTLTGNPS